MESSIAGGDSGLTTVTPNGERVPGGGIVDANVASKFFALRANNIERAVDDVKIRQIRDEIDGEVIGFWLLTGITYWNRDKESVVLLCENTIVSCKYDFVTMKMGEIERVYLKNIKRIQNGNFALPNNSVVIPRLYDGLRVIWGSMEDLPWYQKWNPLNWEIPFATFASHPAFSVEGSESKSCFDVKDFAQSLKKCLSKYPDVKLIENQPIVIESYAGLVSFVHNQSRLGFSRDRGGVSF